jgi:hypothetical protein
MIWITIAVVLLLTAFRNMSLRRRFAQQRTKTAEMAGVLREGVLTRQMIAGLSKRPGAIRGVVTDWGRPGGLATMVAIDDGSVSLYLNPGGGIIGVGTKPNVAAAATQLLAEAERVRDKFTVQTSFPAPAKDSAVFYLLTDDATLASPAIEWDTTRDSSSPLGALNETAQELLTQIRKTSPQ